MPYSRPTVLPEFCRNPPVPATDRIEPPNGVKDTGWVFTEKPPRQYFNWLHYITYQWLGWLSERILKAGHVLTIKAEAGDRLILSSGDGAVGQSTDIIASDGSAAQGGDVNIKAGNTINTVSGNINLQAGVATGAGADGSIFSKSRHEFNEAIKANEPADFEDDVNFNSPNVKFFQGSGMLDVYDKGTFKAQVQSSSPAQEITFTYERLGRLIFIRWDDIVIPTSSRAAGILQFVSPTNPGVAMPSYIRPATESLYLPSIASEDDILGETNGLVYIYPVTSGTSFYFNMYPTILESEFDVTHEHTIHAGCMSFIGADL